jgi:hypothetical protein
MKSENSNIKEEKSTILTSEANPEKSPKGNIKFKFSDGTSNDYDINSISSINPVLFSNIDKSGNYEISLPEYITKISLMDFLFVVKNGINDLEELPGSNPNKFLNLIKISDFFKNDSVSIQIINDIIMKKINEENAFDLLNFSYERLNISNNEEVDNCYFELFYRCLEIIGNNENLFIKNIDRIKLLDKKVIDELLQKTFSHLVYGNYIFLENEKEEISSNDIDPENYFDIMNDNDLNKKKQRKNILTMSNLNSLISSLYDIYGTKNFFEILTLEYMTLFSQESINELNEAPNPTFQMKISFDDIDNYYEEFPINFSINNKTIIFVIFYKISDDSFNVCMKFGDNPNIKKAKNYKNKENTFDDNFCFKIFTFLSIVKVHKGNNSKPLSSQTNLKCLSNNKSMHTIFKLTNFTSALNKSNLFMRESFSNESNPDYFFISVNLKLCYIHSVLTSYLLRNYSKLCRLNEIHKISKQILVLILKNKYLNKKNENELVIGINKWLNDEINLKEDITELIDSIKWERVDDEYIFEFIIKYSNMIVGNEFVENIFIKSFQKKYNSPFIPEMIKSFFKATNVINYGNLYTLMKKNEKFNFAYMSSNVHMTNNNYNMNHFNSHMNNSNTSKQNHMNISGQSNQNNMNNSQISNNKNNNSQGKKLKEKTNNYSFTEENNLNTTSKKVKNIKKIVKYPPNPKESKKTVISNVKLKTNHSNSNKTGLISKLNNNKERQKTPTDFYRNNSNNNHGKLSKKIQEIKQIFSNKNNDSIGQISNNDTIIEKTIFKDAKRKIHKRNKSNNLDYSYTTVNNNTKNNNLMNSYISQNKYYKKNTTPQNVRKKLHNMSYSGKTNITKSNENKI